MERKAFINSISANIREIYKDKQIDIHDLPEIISLIMDIYKSSEFFWDDIEDAKTDLKDIITNLCADSPEDTDKISQYVSFCVDLVFHTVEFSRARCFGCC